jgi:hypothetical protein
MFGPRITPSGSPPVRAATAARHSAVLASDRWLAGKNPSEFPSPAAYAAPMAWITGAGTCVPAAPSR